MSTIYRNTNPSQKYSFYDNNSSMYESVLMKPLIVSSLNKELEIQKRHETKVTPSKFAVKDNNGLTLQSSLLNEKANKQMEMKINDEKDNFEVSPLTKLNKIVKQNLFLELKTSQHE